MWIVHEFFILVNNHVIIWRKRDILRASWTCLAFPRATSRWAMSTVNLLLEGEGCSRVSACCANGSSFVGNVVNACKTGTRTFTPTLSEDLSTSVVISDCQRNLPTVVVAFVEESIKTGIYQNGLFRVLPSRDFHLQLINIFDKSADFGA
ncbi:hypothetical protein BS17DRAFT_482409 [Gyrodon lividus]|nr:hypothetical protein BS17DRAFT_482409 [Gyrodon lividus]